MQLGVIPYVSICFGIKHRRGGVRCGWTWCHRASCVYGTAE